jgi:hypothetical protein
MLWRKLTRTWPRPWNKCASRSFRRSSRCKTATTRSSPRKTTKRSTNWQEVGLKTTKISELLIASRKIQKASPAPNNGLATRRSREADKASVATYTWTQWLVRAAGARKSARLKTSPATSTLRPALREKPQVGKANGSGSANALASNYSTMPWECPAP